MLRTPHGTSSALLMPVAAGAVHRWRVNSRSAREAACTRYMAGPGSRRRPVCTAGQRPRPAPLGACQSDDAGDLLVVSCPPPRQTLGRRSQLQRGGVGAGCCGQNPLAPCAAMMSRARECAARVEDVVRNCRIAAAAHINVFDQAPGQAQRLAADRRARGSSFAQHTHHVAGPPAAPGLRPRPSHRLAAVGDDHVQRQPTRRATYFKMAAAGAARRRSAPWPWG